jgi:hypothetical protein
MPASLVGTVYGLLAAALAAVWLPAFKAGGLRIAPWIPLYAAAVLLSFLQGITSAAGLACLAALFGAAWFYSRTSHGTLRAVLGCATTAIALALALHKLPGFRNPMLLDAVQLSPLGPPFTQYLNFDKASAGLALLAFCMPRAQSAAQWRAAFQATLAWGPVAVVGTASAGLALGYFGVDLKVPPLLPALLAVQLLFVCLPEEAFFRGLIQLPLQRRWTHRPRAVAVAMPAAVATLLFAIAHAGGVERHGQRRGGRQDRSGGGRHPDSLHRECSPPACADLSLSRRRRLVEERSRSYLRKPQVLIPSAV